MTAARKAGLLQMVFLIYGAACGGAFGLEEMVSGSGPGVALAVLAFLPLFWSIPIALTCSELASTFPIEGGYYKWSQMAFGETAGYLTAWWTWLGIFATNATFVVMFNQYLGYWFHLGFWPLYAISLALIWSATYMNLRGIRAVGTSSVWMTMLLLLPFAILIALGLAHWQANPISPFVAPGKPGLTAFAEAMMMGVWLYSGYDKITVSAEEVENPRRNFPLAFGIAVPFVALSYFLPTFAALAGHGHWQDWHEKYFSEVAGLIGGSWLGHAMTAAALLSNYVLLNTTLLAQSRLPSAMSRDGLAPSFFGVVSEKRSVPVYSILFGSAVLSLLALSSFAQLVTIYSVTQMLAYLLIYGSLWKLRRSHPGVNRPFQVPGGNAGLVAITVPPICIAAFTLAKTDSPLIGAIAVLSGPITYVLLRMFRSKPGLAFRAPIR